MKRTLLLIGALLNALLLAACVEVSMESEFETDGSAVHAIRTTVDRTMLDANMLEGELDFDQIERQAEAAGLNVERIDTSNQFGLRLSVEADNNEDLGDILNELFSSINGGQSSDSPFSGSFTESGGGLSATSYEFELTVDGTALFEQGEEELGEDFEMGIEMMRQFLNITYTVSMPGEIVDHNGNVTGTGTVQWDLPIQESQTFLATSEEGSSFPILLIAGVAIGGIALVLVIIGGIMLTRSKPAPTPTSPQSSAAPASGNESSAGQESTSEPQTGDGSVDSQR